MKLWLSLTLLIAISSAWASPKNENILEEVIYTDFQQKIAAGTQLSHFLAFSAQEQSLYVDALWDLADEGNPNALKLVAEINPVQYDLTQRFRVSIIALKHKMSARLPAPLMAELRNALLAPEVDVKLIYLIASYEKELTLAGHKDLITLAKKFPEYKNIGKQKRPRNVSDAIVYDLFHHVPDTTSFMNGEYKKSVKIYMFCRTNRLYPCLMTMRDIHGNEIRKSNGSLWTNPALAAAASGLGTHLRNGHTPAGIHTIDSVMPVADQQISYGKFRRMILNFVPKSTNENLSKALLPKSSHGEDWWKQNVVARDAGRNLFRIHGTGRQNQDPKSSFFPFMRTSGCIAQRENTYGKTTYRDQQNLLNAVMTAMELEPTFNNETKIKGLLYMIEIDNKNAPVTAQDLALRGIE